MAPPALALRIMRRSMTVIASSPIPVLCTSLPAGTIPHASPHLLHQNGGETSHIVHTGTNPQVVQHVPPSPPHLKLEVRNVELLSDDRRMFAHFFANFPHCRV